MKKKELARKLREAELRISLLESELHGIRTRQPVVWPSGPIWIDPRYHSWPYPLVTCGTSTTMTALKGTYVTNQIDDAFKEATAALVGAIT